MAIILIQKLRKGPSGLEHNRFPPPHQLDGMYNDNWNPPPPPPFGHPNEPCYNWERRNWDAHHYNYPQEQQSHSREMPYKRRRSHLHDIWGPNFDEEEVQDRFNFNRRAEPSNPYFVNRFKKPRNFEYKNSKNFNKSRPDLKQVELRKENNSSVNDSQKPCKQEPEKPCQQEPLKLCKQEEKSEGKPASSATIVDKQTKTASQDFRKIEKPDEPLKKTETKTETQTSPVSVLQEPEHTLDIEEMLSKMENPQENTISLNDIDQNRSFFNYTPLDNLKVVDMDLGSPIFDKVKSDLSSGDSSNETVQQARKNFNKPKESKIEISSKEDGAVEMADNYKERERLKERRSSVYDRWDIESKDGDAVTFADNDRERERLKIRRSSVYDRSNNIESKEEAIVDKDRERERLKKRRSSIYDRSDDIESKEETIAEKDRKRERLKKRRSSVYDRSDDIESKEEADKISDKDRERERLKQRRSSVYDRSDDRKKSEFEHKDRRDRRKSIGVERRTSILENSSDSANLKRPRLSPKPLEEEKSPYFPSLNKNYRIPKIAKESDDKTPKFSKAGTPFVSATSIINKITTKESAIYKKESPKKVLSNSSDKPNINTFKNVQGNVNGTLTSKQAVKATEPAENVKSKQKIINKPIVKVKKKSYSSKEVKDESVSKKNYKYSLEKVKASDQTKSESKGIKNNMTHTLNRKEKTKKKKLLAEQCTKKQTLKIVIDNRYSIQKVDDIKNSKVKSISSNNNNQSTSMVDHQFDIQSPTVNPSTMVQSSTNTNKIDDKSGNDETTFDKTLADINVIDKPCPNKTKLNDNQSSRVHSNSSNNNMPSKIEVQPSTNKIDQFDKDIRTRETKSDETRANIDESCPNKKSVCAQQPSDIKSFNSPNNNSITEVQANSNKVDDQFDKHKNKSDAKQAHILNVNKPCPNEKSDCTKTIDDISSATEVAPTADNIDDQDLEPFVISPDCNSKESTDSANSKTDNSFSFLGYISECFAKPSQSNNCLGLNNCSSSKQLKKQTEATSTIKTEKLEIKISTAIKSEFSYDEKCQSLIMDPFPRSQRPQVGVVERDCVEEAIVMEQNLDIQTEIQVVKQENKKNDLDLEIIEVPEDVIDLTIDECSESEDCIESAKSINMSVKEELLRLFDENSNDKNEKITLYRDDIQCGAEEEVQAVSASLLPSTPKTSDAIKSEVSQNKSITENESNVNLDADLIREDLSVANSNSSNTAQAEVRYSAETGPDVVGYENCDKHSRVSICKSTLPITTGQQFTEGTVLKSTVQRDRERTKVSVPVTTGMRALTLVGTVRDNEQTRVFGPNVLVTSGTPPSTVLESEQTSSISVPVSRRISEPGAHPLPIVNAISTVVRDTEQSGSICVPVSRRISEPNVPVTSRTPPLPTVGSILNSPVIETEQTGSIPVSRRICEPDVHVTSGTGKQGSEQTTGQSVPVSKLSGPYMPVTSAVHPLPNGSAHSSTPRDATKSTDQPILFNWQEVVAGYIFLIFETIGADIVFWNLMNTKNIPAFVMYQEIKMRNKIRISKFNEYALELMSMFSKINLSFAESHPDVAIPAIFKFFEKYGVGNRSGFFIFLDTIMSMRKEFYLNHYFLRLLYTVVHAYADAIRAKKESTVNPGPVFTDQQLQMLNRQIDFCNMVTALLYGKNKNSHNPPKRFPILKQHLQKQNSNLINMSPSNNSFDRSNNYHQNNQNAQQNSPRPLHASAPNNYQHQVLNNLQYPQNKQGYSSQHQVSPSSPLIFKIPPDRATQLRSVRKNNFSPTRSDSASNSPRQTFGLCPSGNSARHTSPHSAIPYTPSYAATPSTPSHSNQSVSQNTSPHIATPFTPTHSNQSASQIRRHVYAPMPFASNSIFEPILSPPISKSPVTQLSSNLSSVTQSSTVTSPVNQHITSPVYPFIMDSPVHPIAVTSPVNQPEVIASPVNQPTIITSPVNQRPVIGSPVNQSSNIGSPLINQVDESFASRSLVNEPVSSAVDSVTVKDEPSELNANRQIDDQEVVTIDLTWLDDMDSEQLKEELDFIKQEFDDEHVVLNEEQFPLAHIIRPSRSLWDPPSPFNPGLD